MKLVYAGYKQMAKFNLSIPEMKFKQIKPREVFETDDTLGRQIVRKYPDVYTLDDYEKKFGKLKADIEVKIEKQKKTQKDKMEVTVQSDKSNVGEPNESK